MLTKTRATSVVTVTAPPVTSRATSPQATTQRATALAATTQRG